MFRELQSAVLATTVTLNEACRPALPSILSNRLSSTTSKLPSSGRLARRDTCLINIARQRRCSKDQFGEPLQRFTQRWKLLEQCVIHAHCRSDNRRCRVRRERRRAG